MSRAQLSVPLVEAQQVLDRPPRVLVDLRSPGEFELDHLPQAVNVPLFDDLERALIGRLYVQSSPQAAFEEGRRVTREKIESFTATVAELAGWRVPAAADLVAGVESLTDGGITVLERELVPTASRTEGAVVFYCWRGGLRSRAVVAFLRRLGLEAAVAIEGGYRAYRSWTRRSIEEWRPPPSFVLRGLTGVGKTLVLRELARLRPEWALDLESLAGHRSSILGMVGLQPVSQKLFESRLVGRIRAGLGGVCVLEGESRKVGDIVLPSPVWEAVDRGTALELRADRARRVRVLLDDYLSHESSRAELAERLPFLETRLGARWKGVLVSMLESAQEADLVGLLLEHYYDPLYRHSERGRRYAASFESEDPVTAAREIVQWIERRSTLTKASWARRSTIAAERERAGL